LARICAIGRIFKCSVAEYLLPPQTPRIHTNHQQHIATMSSTWQRIHGRSRIDRHPPPPGNRALDQIIVRSKCLQASGEAEIQSPGPPPASAKSGMNASGFLNHPYVSPRQLRRVSHSGSRLSPPAPIVRFGHKFHIPYIHMDDTTCAALRKSEPRKAARTCSPRLQNSAERIEECQFESMQSLRTRLCCVGISNKVILPFKKNGIGRH